MRKKQGLTRGYSTNTGCFILLSMLLGAQSVLAQTDWGDAPETLGFNTTSANGGPSHTFTNQLYLGDCIDSDDDGQPDANATGDDTGDENFIDNTIIHGTCTNETWDDEDTTFITDFNDGQTAPTINFPYVNTTGSSGFMQCWVDYNKNGVFENTPAEQAALVTLGASGFTNLVLPDVPENASSFVGTAYSSAQTYMRCRLSSTLAEVASPDGPATSGEVEDHLIVLKPYIVVCPAGTSQVDFNWSTTGNNWPNGQKAAITYNLPYEDNNATTATQTIGVTVNPIDPDNRNCDGDQYDVGNHPWGALPWNGQSAGRGVVTTATDPWDSSSACAGRGSPGTLGTFVNGSSLLLFNVFEDHLEETEWRFTFDSPAYIASFKVGDVDFVGNAQTPTLGSPPLSETEIAGNSFQDEVYFEATFGSGAAQQDVPVTMFLGSQLQQGAFKNGQHALAALAGGTTPETRFPDGFNGNINATDPEGIVEVTTTRPFDRFSVFYSNGADDAAREQALPFNNRWWTGDTSGPHPAGYTGPTLIPGASNNVQTNGVSDDQAVFLQSFVMCVIENDLDYGDAPDGIANYGMGNYRTNIGDNGPSHALGVANAPILGTIVDADNGDLDNPGATADDGDMVGNTYGAAGLTAAGDDEDGVIFGPLVRGADATATITLAAGTNAGLVNAWVDFNQDGVFGTGEQIATDLNIASGATQNLVFNVPKEAIKTVLGTTYARFRVSTAGGDLPTGPADDGEVEDYAVTITPGVNIGNLIWNDNGVGGGTANDGIVNGSEAGIEGVQVELYAAGDTPGVDTPVDTTTTASDGSYILAYAPGQYFVHIPASEFGVAGALNNMISTTGQGSTDGDDDNVDENGDDTETDGVSSPVYDLQLGLEPASEAGFVGLTVPSEDDSNSNTSVDFGFYEPVSIGNLVWMDNGAGGGVANDGIVNGTEVGVGDVVVELYASGDTPGVDTPADTTTTAVDGSYILTAPPGQYFVHIPASEFGATEPLADKVSTTGQGVADNTDDDNVGEDGDDIETDGVSSGVYNLQAGLEPTSEAGFVGTTTSPSPDNSTNSTADFGFYEPVSIGNLVWMDNGAGGGIANDGIVNGTESGVPGVVVELYASGDTAGVDTPIDSTTTAADGSYILTAPPGQYFVHIPASEFAATEPLEDKVSTTGQGAADNTNDDNVAEDGDDTEADGVSTGVYDLRAGLEPTSEAGFVGTTVSPTNDDSTNSTADFGFYEPVSIGNLVWMDNGAGGGIANNGIVDGTEVGVANVVVELYASGDTPGVDMPADTTSTAADGSYILTAPPGQYFAHIPASEFAATEPLEDKVSTTGQGAADNTNDDNVAEDGDDTEADGVSTGVYDLRAGLEPTSEAGFVGTTVSPTNDDSTNSTADFGFYEPVSIGNLVWMDNGTGGGVANDGIVNGTESGVPGVVVELYTSGETPGVDMPADSTATAADGSYIFDSLIPGQYFVHIPASEFGATEPLEGKVSTTGQGTADNAEDDNVSEDGDDVESDGVSSPVYTLIGGSEPTSEAGFAGTSTGTQSDDSTNSTVDFGFYAPIAVGNLVWMDNGAGGGVANDGIVNGTEIGVPGVMVELYASGDTPGVDTPVDTTDTAADGSYILTAPPGQYFVHIPAGEFAATEPLEDKVSTTGQGAADNTDDDNAAEDGDDTEADGVSSGVYDLRAGLEPSSEAGFVGTTVSPVPDSSTNSTVDFGFYEPVSIGNLVWMDNSAGGGIANNGIMDGAESGVPDVVIELYAAGDTPGVHTPVDTTATAADGSYILTAPPGEYFVHIPVSEFAASEPLEEKISTTGQGAADNTDDDNVAEDGDDTETDGVSTGIYDLRAGLEPTSEAGFIGSTVSPSSDESTNSTADFGFYALVSVGNRVWLDDGEGGGVANDGILNGTEQGVENVVVELYAAGDTPGVDAAVANTTTAADGSYIIDSVVPGNYFVHIPAGEFASTEPLEGTVSSTGQGAADNSDDDNVSEDGDDIETDGVSSPVYTLIGDTEPTSEAGFVGTTVSTQDDDNTNTTVDFGFYAPMSIGNLVWMDNGIGGGVANDGVLNGTEVGIANVVMQLYATGDTPGVDSPVDSTTTAADGTYILTAPPGEYFVHIPVSEFAASEPLAEKVSTTGQGTTDGDDDNADENGDDTETDGVSSPVYNLRPETEPTSEAGFTGTTVSPSADNNTNSTVDFGFYEPVSIGNLVWMDNGIGGGIANNGILDGTEQGVANVVIELYVAGDTPGVDTPVDSTATAADGSYILTAQPGQYFVHIPASEFAATEPLEEKISSTGQGATDNSSDDNLNEDGDDLETDGVSSPVYTLLGGTEPTSEAGFVGSTVSPSDDNNTNSTVDFAFYAQVSVGNFVWSDDGAGGGTPNDGIINGTESGIADVNVELYAMGDTPGVDTPVSSTVTEADGSYIIDSIVPGNYFVHIPASEFAQGEPLESNVSTRGQGLVENTGDDNANEDGDDIESDGVSSPVYELVGDTEPTSEAGFSGIATSTQDDDNTNSTVDFGFLVPVSIGSFIWDDLNGDGLQTSNEPPVQGAQVALMVDSAGSFVPAQDLQGVPVSNQTTAPNGLYQFSDIPPGTYKVQITPPAGLFPTSVSNANDDSVENDSNIDPAPVPAPAIGTYQSGSIELTSGAEVAETQTQRGDEQDGAMGGPADLSGDMTVDFGFVRPASIGDYVWLDLDMDGIQDANEEPIGGVEITLTPPSGVDVGAGPGNPIMAVTDPNGYYIFTGLMPFTDPDPTLGYVVSVNPATIPANYVQTFDEGPAGTIGVLDHTSDPIQLEPQEFHETADFGYAPPDGSIGDTIWVDANGNGEQELGESGIEGVTVSLTPPATVDLGNGPGVAITTTTDEDGKYLFTGLPLEQVYVVTVDDTTLPPGFGFDPDGDGDPDVRDGGSTEADHETTVALSATDPLNPPINLDADFGYLPPAEQNNSIGDTVWFDVDTDGNGPALSSSGNVAGDGTDVIETPFEDVTIDLYLDNNGDTVIDGGDTLLATTVTDDQGAYLFSGLPDGDYIVQVSDTNGVLDGLVPTFDADGLTTPNQSAVDLDAASLDANAVDNRDQDFGYAEQTPLAMIGDTVWLDSNGDGVIDATEEGIANVTVTLTPPASVDVGAGSGNPISVVTDANGNYIFNNLPPFTDGDPAQGYIVMVDSGSLPSGLVQTYDEGPSGAIGFLDNTSDPIQLNPGEFHDTADFGYNAPTGSIGDTVWIDSNGDGEIDSGESGVSNVVVTLTPPAGVDIGAGPGNPIITTTDENGYYLFTGLLTSPTGETYTVSVNTAGLPNGGVAYVNTGDPDGGFDSTSQVPLTDAEPINLDQDFGYQPPASQNNTVGDTVWLDEDSDGTQNNGEAGIPGVTLDLLNNVPEVVASTVTDADGMYLFTGIPDGIYDVVVTDTNGALDNLNQTFDNNGLASPNQSTVDLDSGSISATPIIDLVQDFGYVSSTPSSGADAGVIGDTVFFDSNNNGVPDPGEGIEGVIVELYDSNGVLIMSMTTDENGQYLFERLQVSPSGETYEVRVVISSLPNGGVGWINSVDPDSGNPGDSISVWTLTDAEPENLDQDFGYIGADNNTITGTVWSDSDGDGSQAESGTFAGVTIVLKDQDGNIIQETVTDADGNYEFTNLPDGVYVVEVTDEDNVLDGFEHTDSPNGTSDTGDGTSKDDTGYVVDLDSSGLSAGPVTNVTGDFGYQPVVTNPITLGAVSATVVSGDEVLIEWHTQTEVGNLGFNVYGRVNDEWVALNTSLIVGQGDATWVQSYQLKVRTQARIFAIGDVDLTGQETLNEPFSVSLPQGTPAPRKSIDWGALRKERERQTIKRERARQHQLQQQNQQLQQQNQQRRLTAPTGQSVR